MTIDEIIQALTARAVAPPPGTTWTADQAVTHAGALEHAAHDALWRLRVGLEHLARETSWPLDLGDLRLLDRALGVLSSEHNDAPHDAIVDLRSRLGRLERER